MTKGNNLRNKSRNTALLVSAALCGCVAQEADVIQVREMDEVTDATPTFEELKAESVVDLGATEGYLVESDMLFPTQAQLSEYYEDVYVNLDKSIVNLASGVRDVRATPTSIRYCFAAGWGVNNGTYTAPALNGVRTNIQAAMEEWEQVANLEFVYRDDLDGATCSNSGANPGVDFVVTHYNNTSTATGPFPSNPFSTQYLRVPTSGISRLLAIHELGHAIGLRHEHIHSGASPMCSEGGTYEQLTGFDTLSCMKYNNCTVNNSINGTEISFLDGIGTRMLYGAPARWYPSYGHFVLN